MTRRAFRTQANIQLIQSMPSKDLIMGSSVFAHHINHMELGSVQSSMWQILDIACRESHGKCPTSAWMTAHNPHGSLRGLSPAWADNPGFRSSEHLWVLCTAAGLMTMVSPGRRPSLPLSGIPTARQAFPYCDARHVCLAAGSQLLYIYREAHFTGQSDAATCILAYKDATCSQVWLAAMLEAAQFSAEETPALCRWTCWHCSLEFSFWHTMMTLKLPGVH